MGFPAAAAAFLGGGGRLGTALSWGRNILSTGKKSIGVMPTLEERADIIVWGNPQASRNDLYWIAVAAAFGFVTNKTSLGLTLPKGVIYLEWNGEQNYVRFMAHQNASWDGVLYWMYRFRGLGAAFTKLPSVFYGPPDNTVGGKWQWYDRLTPGIPGKADIKDLPFQARLILTQQATYRDKGVDKVSENPVPPGDDQSRGWPSIASDPTVPAIDPSKGVYTHPEYIMFQLLGAPCSIGSKLPTPIPDDFALPGALVNNRNPPAAKAGPVDPPTPPSPFNPFS